MNRACPYCGAAIGDGHRTHITPVRVPQLGTSKEFAVFDIAKIYDPDPMPHRTIETCADPACIAKAEKVRPSR